jgi:hypothetical protein
MFINGKGHRDQRRTDVQKLVLKVAVMRCDAQRGNCVLPSGTAVPFVNVTVGNSDWLGLNRNPVPKSTRRGRGGSKLFQKIFLVVIFNSDSVLFFRRMPTPCECNVLTPSACAGAFKMLLPQDDVHFTFVFGCCARCFTVHKP